MFGWRARIGILVPSSNTTMEMEFHNASPEGVSVHTARMILPEVTSFEEEVEAMQQMNRDMEKAARNIASVEPSIIVYGCTTGSFIKGLDYDRELIAKVEDITGYKATTTSTAVVEAIKELKLKRIGVATPYLPEIDELEKEFLEQNIPGIKVVDIKGLNIKGNIPRGKLYPSSSYDLARQVDSPECDGIFISCTNFRTFEVLDHLEKDLQKPVLSSNQASLWAALRAAKVIEPLKGFGTLLRRHI